MISVPTFPLTLFSAQYLQYKCSHVLDNGQSNLCERDSLSGNHPMIPARNVEMPRLELTTVNYHSSTNSYMMSADHAILTEREEFFARSMRLRASVKAVYSF